jgi:LPXTG-motif cell wall-anchored protein
MRKLALILGAILAITMFNVVYAADTVTVNLDALNSSGISGTATLTSNGDTTTVVLNVTGEPSGGSEPVHIHTGQCGPTLDGVKYPLKNVEGGTSTTTINATLASIETGGFAINVHESAANISHYVACGNIPAMAATSLPKTGEMPIAPVLAGAGLLALTGYALRRRFA